MSHRVRSTLAALVAAGAICASAPSAFAESPANSPEPVAGEPGCDGLIMAAFNHGSGEFGASGNPTSSAGPGYFFGPDTHESIEILVRPFCTA
jgi:hypothetical protein